MTLEGVVVTSGFTPANTGFFIGDAAGGPNSGVWVYAPFMSADVIIEPGNEITITAIVGEYAPAEEEDGDTGAVEAPELTDYETQTQLILGSAEDVVVTGVVDMPMASLLTGDTLAVAETAEAYEGVTVSFEGVSVTGAYEGGMFQIDGGNSVGEMFVDFEYVRLGDTFTNLTGVVGFKDGLYTLSPRSNADVEGHATTCGSCTADLCIDDLAAGNLVISEIMANPDTCGDRDNAGEYIEVYNAAAGSVDLNCLALTDGGEHVGYVETETIVPAGGYAVLQRRGEEYCYDDAIAATGAPTAIYRKAMSLNNDGDSVTLSYEGTVFDTVTYTASGDDSWPVAEGASMRLDGGMVTVPGGASANDEPVNWCVSMSPIGDTTDLGTPGAANGLCAGIFGK